MQHVVVGEWVWENNRMQNEVGYIVCPVPISEKGKLRVKDGKIQKKRGRVSQDDTALVFIHSPNEVLRLHFGERFPQVLMQASGRGGFAMVGHFQKQDRIELDMRGNSGKVFSKAYSWDGVRLFQTSMVSVTSHIPVNLDGLIEELRNPEEETGTITFGDWSISYGRLRRLLPKYIRIPEDGATDYRSMHLKPPITFS